MNSVLSIKNLRKTFSERCFIDIDSLDINKGEIFSILGPSGCGKTSLLRMIGGFEVPDCGSIVLNGEDITYHQPNTRKINTVFQSYALFPHLTVWENIAFGLRISNFPNDRLNEAVDHILTLVQLKDEAYKKPYQISGGQKQRVAIARALVMKPQVLLLDEPLSALDFKLKQRMLLNLDEIHDEVGITFVFVTHDQYEAMGISNRIAVMNNGKIEQVGTPAEIYETPKNSFVAAFIGDANFFNGIVSESISQDYFLIDIDGLESIKCYKDRPLSIGSKVSITIRPEKFYISLEMPNKTDNYNRVKGTVEDIIYFGHQTKYWIRVGQHRIAVFRQHNHLFLDEQQITWGNTVWLTWSADDGYILDTYAKDNILGLEESLD